MACRLSTIVRLQINHKIAEDAHRQPPKLPAKLSRHIENQQTANSGLIATRVTVEVGVERVTVAGVVVERRRQLDVNTVRERKSRPHLPCQHEGVRCRNLLR